ncbi:MAG: ribosomal RNA small subunit methyltransferase E [Candidatus Dojkabacteria bacterium]|nr:MAG: ribosomal RNA small subunit methyltransferase E [Candidatus Dojkabacteria bacterium]
MHRFILRNKHIRNKTIVFNEEQSHKISKVLRMAVGDIVEVFDNSGWVYEVELFKLTNEIALGKIVSQKLIEKTSHITLFQSLIKLTKIDFIIEKSVELGVDKIVFFRSEYSQINTKWIHHKHLSRWQRIAESAAEQSGRVFVPQIMVDVRKFDDIMSESADTGAFILDPDGEVLSSKLLKHSLHICFFVGPEGGFSHQEINIAEKLGIRKIKLSNNILRSETASLAFLSQIFLFIN